MPAICAWPRCLGGYRHWPPRCATERIWPIRTPGKLPSGKRCLGHLRDRGRHPCELTACCEHPSGPDPVLSNQQGRDIVNVSVMKTCNYGRLRGRLRERRGGNKVLGRRFQRAVD
jgi:hypothetical protein